MSLLVVEETLPIGQTVLDMIQVLAAREMQIVLLSICDCLKVGFERILRGIPVNIKLINIYMRQTV